MKKHIVIIASCSECFACWYNPNYEWYACRQPDVGAIKDLDSINENCPLEDYEEATDDRK